MKIVEMQTKWPSIPWIGYFNNLLTPHHVLSIEEPVAVAVPLTYFDKFEALMLKSEKTR
jgi:hypothetical protein